MDLLAPLREAPEETALLFDVDGTLSPIAPRPELARVPAETRVELARLARSYLLVACISGRPGEEAAALVGLDGIRYVGNHGLELDDRAPELAAQIAAFRDSVALPVEDKGLSRRVVVLPQPLGPRSEKTSPWSLDRSTSTTVRSPKNFVTPARTMWPSPVSTVAGRVRP